MDFARNNVLLVLLGLHSLSIGLSESVSLTSSWEQADQEAACPGEAVTFTCTAQDTVSIELIFCGERSAWLHDDFDNKDSLVRNRSDFIFTLTNVVANGNNFRMTANLSTMANLSYNESSIQCSDGNSTAKRMLLIAGRPSPPTMFMTSTRAQQCSSTEVTFSWEPPEYSGHATIDNYTLTVNGNNISLLPHQISYTLSLLHRAAHQAHVSTSNCASTSTPAHLTITLRGCSSPPPLLRGTRSSSCTGVGSAVEYHCGPGLVLQGQAVVTCLDEGAWSSDPTKFKCKAVCKIVNNPRNGQVNVSNEQFEDIVLSLTCHTGYIYQGPNLSTCTKEGLWVPDPSITLCRAVCEAPQAPSNGEIVMVNVERTELEYRCDDGLSPSGIIKSVCMDTNDERLWIPNPATLECHTPGICAIPQVIEQGQFISPNLVGTVSEGEMIEFMCHSTKHMASRNATCLSTGDWNPNINCVVQGSSAGQQNAVIIAVVLVSLVAVAVLVGLLVGIYLFKFRRRRDVKCAAVVEDVIAQPLNVTKPIKHSTKKIVYKRKKKTNPNYLHEVQHPDGLVYADMADMGVPDEGENPKDENIVEYAAVLSEVTPHSVAEVRDKPLDSYAVVYSAVEPTSTSKCMEGHEDTSSGGLMGHVSAITTATPELHGELMYADLEIEVKLKTSSVGFKKGKLKKHEAACAVQYTAVAGSQVPQHHNSEDDKINFSDPDSMLNLDIVLLQMQPLKGSLTWHRLGESLGVATGTLDTIGSQCGSQEECMVETIDAWLRDHRSRPTWRELARALEQVGQTGLAASINRVYLTGTLPVDPQEDNTAVTIEIARCPETGESTSIHSSHPPPLPPKDSASSSTSLFPRSLPCSPPPPLLPKKKKHRRSIHDQSPIPLSPLLPPSCSGSLSVEGKVFSAPWPPPPPPPPPPHRSAKVMLDGHHSRPPPVKQRKYAAKPLPPKQIRLQDSQLSVSALQSGRVPQSPSFKSPPCSESSSRNVSCKPELPPLPKAKPPPPPPHHNKRS